MRITCITLVITLGAGCSDEPIAPKDGTVHDAPARDLLPDAPRDSGPQEAAADARGPDGPPPLPCNIHHDCLQGSYCYYKKCVTDPDYPVYHCNKKDSSGNDTCPPGHKCVDKAGKISICAESSTYTCKDACDCGPAHCCKDVSGTKRCVKDTADPWLPGGTIIGGAACVQGTDATYCHTDPTCHEGRQAHADPKHQGKFRAFDRKTNSTTTLCGGKRCFGSAINCKAGASCIDTQQAAPLPGKACLLLSGGTCVSNALAESVFGYKPADLLPKCSSTCPKGQKCDAGWVSDRKWAYRRIVGTCGSCGNGTCDPGEWSNNCSKDCSCGDETCTSSEAKTCYQDCAKCGNKLCDPGEMAWLGPVVGPALPAMGTCLDCSCGNGTCDKAELVGGGSVLPTCTKDCSCGDGVCAQDESCAKDCVCLDSNTYLEQGRICGDGICAGHDGREACEDLESCLSCEADCGPCAWELAERTSGTALPRIRKARSAWGTLKSGIVVVGETDLTMGIALQYDGVWSSHTLPMLLGFNSVWKSGSGEIYASSSMVGIFKYSGGIWRPMIGPSSGSLTGCTRILGRASNDVYASCKGGLLRYDGNAANKWQVLFSSSVYEFWVPPAPSDELFVISGGVSRCNVTTKTCVTMMLPTPAAPDGGVDFGSPPVGLEPWGPSPPPKAAPSAIWGVQSGSKLELFVVGYSLGDFGQVPWTWRYDSKAGFWTESPLPGFSPLYQNIRTVWARSSSEVHVMGDAGYLLRYDGKTWSKLQSPTSGDLVAVWGDAADVFALDEATGAILRYDGKQLQWKIMTTPTGVDVPRVAPSAGVWGASTADVFAIRGNAVIRHDGKAFKAMSLPTTVPLYGIAGGSASDVLAVGGAGTKQPATVLRYDGATWSKQPAPGSGPLLDVVRAGNSYYAVGAGGNQILRFDGASWKIAAAVPQAKSFSGIAQCSTTKLAVVGTDPLGTKGYVALVDTTTKGYTPAVISGVNQLLDVWCDSAGTIVAVGGLVEPTGFSMMGIMLARPKIVSCTVGSGLSCKVIDPPLRPKYNQQGGLHGIWGTSKSDLYAVGQEGALLHYDGKSWKPLAADIRAAGHNWGCEDLLGVWGTKKDLFVTTRSGVLRLGKLP